MPGLDKLKLRLGVGAHDRSKDALLISLLEAAGAWAKEYCRTDGAIPEDIVVSMAAHDYGVLGAEGIERRGVSGLSESYLPDYPEQIMVQLRRFRRIGVPS